MIRFDISSLVKARLGASLTLEIDSGPQELTDLQLNFVRGTLQAVRVQKGVLVRGTVKSELELECVRCLSSFVLPVTLEAEETFRLSGTKAKPEMPYAVGSDGWIDLAPLLREQAWLAIPMKPLCDPECKGWCVHCGANLNLEPCTCEEEKIDPRLAVLKDLL